VYSDQALVSEGSICRQCPLSNGVDKDTPVDPGQVHPALETVEKGVEGTHHIVSIEPEVEGEMVAVPAGMHT
jgi:hypothetical protein